jgi:hypothetical protein
MNKIITAVMLFLAVTMSVPAFASDISTTIYGDYKSSYTLSNDYITCRKQPLQGGVTFTSGQNWLDLWGSTALSDNSSNPGCREYDVKVAHDDHIGDVANVEVAVAVFNLMPIDSFDGGDIMDFSGEVTGKTAFMGVTPSVKLEILDSPGLGLHRAIVWTVGGSNSFKLSPSITLSQSLKGSHQSSIAGTIATYEATLSHPILGGKGSVSAGVKHFHPVGADKEERNVGSVGFSYTY